MNIKAQTDNKISVELTKDDLKELGITYDELDYSNVETRRVLWTLLDEAGHRLGRSICLTDKMLIEAIPDDKGGCMLFFTVVDNSSDAISGTGGHIINPKTVCQTDQIDNIGALSKALYNADCVTHSELYTNGSSYRLIISAKPTYTEKIINIACEYCDICNGIAAAMTKEHWKKLASPDAVGLLAALS